MSWPKVPFVVWLTGLAAFAAANGNFEILASMSLATRGCYRSSPRSWLWHVILPVFTFPYGSGFHGDSFCSPISPRPRNPTPCSGRS